jgi:hypothetical protein
LTIWSSNQIIYLNNRQHDRLRQSLSIPYFTQIYFPPNKTQYTMMPITRCRDLRMDGMPCENNSKEGCHGLCLSHYSVLEFEEGENICQHTTNRGNGIYPLIICSIVLAIILLLICVLMYSMSPLMRIGFLVLSFVILFILK